MKNKDENVEEAKNTLITHIAKMAFAEEVFKRADNELNVYKPYTDLIDLYDSVMETINQKQFDITANAKAYKEGKETYNVDIFDFAFDITDGLNAYGSALVTGEEDVEFDEWNSLEEWLSEQIRDYMNILEEEKW